jgi:hypothetical protein
MLLGFAGLGFAAHRRRQRDRAQFHRTASA